MNANRVSCHERGHEGSTELRNPLCLDTDARGGGSLSMKRLIPFAPVAHDAVCLPRPRDIPTRPWFWRYLTGLPAEAVVPRGSISRRAGSKGISLWVNIKDRWYYRLSPNKGHSAPSVPGVLHRQVCSSKPKSWAGASYCCSPASRPPSRMSCSTSYSADMAEQNDSCRRLVITPAARALYRDQSHRPRSGAPERSTHPRRAGLRFSNSG